MEIMAADFHLGSQFTTEVEVGEGSMTFLSPFSYFSYLLSGTSGGAERVN